MREILLKGFTLKTVKVDDEDFDRLSKYNWGLTKSRGLNYAVAKIQGKTMGMHQFLLPGFPTVDHVNHDGLDNQKKNLRPATQLQQTRNKLKPSKTCSSKFKGVHLMSSGRFRARIRIYNRRIHLGCFLDETEAAKKYDEAALRYFGEFACLNFKDI